MKAPETLLGIPTSELLTLAITAVTAAIAVATFIASATRNSRSRRSLATLNDLLQAETSPTHLAALRSIHRSEAGQLMARKLAPTRHFLWPYLFWAMTASIANSDLRATLRYLRTADNPSVPDWYATLYPVASDGFFFLLILLLGSPIVYAWLRHMHLNKADNAWRYYMGLPLLQPVRHTFPAPTPLVFLRGMAASVGVYALGLNLSAFALIIQERVQNGEVGPYTPEIGGSVALLAGFGAIGLVVSVTTLRNEIAERRFPRAHPPTPHLGDLKRSRQGPKHLPKL